jgi:flagellar P-ring protein precursor FlgI
MGENIAKAKDAQSIIIDVPNKFKGNVVNLMAEVENLEVEGDQRAKIILDERTGTVVIGENVRISKVAVSHGNLTVKIAESVQVSQPTTPLAGGQTVVTPQTETSVKEEKSNLAILQSGPSIGELVNSLNSVGVSPRDIIAILNTIKAAGALNADLEII